MRVVSDLSWSRRGLTLLWGAEGLDQVAKASQVTTIREFFALSKKWPEDLPAAGGDAVVVAGLEGCLDSLTPDDAMAWLEHDLRQLLLSFQDRYENQAGLVLWIPGGKKRITMPRATEQYQWQGSGAYSGSALPLGRCLWAGADSDVRRVLNPSEINQDPDGPAWIGLNHPRIS
jgi:hypothetical protein